MQMIAKAKKVLSDPDQTKSFLNSVKNFLVNLLRAAILICVG